MYDSGLESTSDGDDDKGSECGVGTKFGESHEPLRTGGESSGNRQRDSRNGVAR